MRFTQIADKNSVPYEEIYMSSFLLFPPKNPTL